MYELYQLSTVPAFPRVLGWDSLHRAHKIHFKGFYYEVHFNPFAKDLTTTMEVASPLSFAPVPGNKRSLSCSPQMVDTHRGNNQIEHENSQQPAKRRRFHADSSVDSLSNAFSSHSPFFSSMQNQQRFMLQQGRFKRSSAAMSHATFPLMTNETGPWCGTTTCSCGLLAILTHFNTVVCLGSANQILKRQRINTSSPVHEDLKRVVEEQKAMIESLQTDKSTLSSSLEATQKDRDRVVKENQILRRAVNIQEERRGIAESQVKAAQEYRVTTEEQIKRMEQVIMTLRYHLQTQQSTRPGNDFMGNRPPDVY